MATKNKISAQDIITFYMDDLVEYQSKPHSVQDFTSLHHFDDVVFYKHFTSFNDLEKTIYKVLLENSLLLLQQSPEYHSYNKKDKLLSLYYTFFESLTLNQDYIKLSLNGYENHLKVLSVFSKMKRTFLAFIDNLDVKTFSLNIESIDNLQKKTLNESAWFQLLITIKFWLDDRSENSEKTDIFIEKSITTSMEFLETKTLYNVIDLVKFLYNEKMQ